MEEEVEEEVRGGCNHGGKSQKDETLLPVKVEDRRFPSVQNAGETLKAGKSQEMDSSL